jgi:hypothetical protein
LPENNLQDAMLLKMIWGVFATSNDAEAHDSIELEHVESAVGRRSPERCFQYPMLSKALIYILNACLY